jgi:hypothetical protein
MPTVACEVLVPLVSGRTRLPWSPDKVPDWEYASAYLFGGISPVGSPAPTLSRNACTSRSARRLSSSTIRSAGRSEPLDKRKARPHLTFIR